MLGQSLETSDTKGFQGQEAEAKKRIKAFEGFQITNALAERGGAKPGWKFMHCLPRHPEEYVIRLTIIAISQENANLTNP